MPEFLSHGFPLRQESMMLCQASPVALLRTERGRQGPGHTALDTNASQGSRASRLSTWTLALDHGFESKVSHLSSLGAQRGDSHPWLCIEAQGRAFKNSDANASLPQTWIQPVWGGA